MNYKPMLLLTLTLCCVCTLLAPSGVDAASRLTLNTKWAPWQMLPGQMMPATDDTITVWLDKDKARRDDPKGQSVIYDRKKNLMYLLYHKFNVYSVRTLNGTEVTDTTAGFVSGFEEGLAGLRPQSQANVEAVDSTKKIRGYLCHKYLLHQQAPSELANVSSENEFWATEEITIDRGLYDIIRTAMLTVGAISSRQLNMEMGKILGVPVLSITKVSGNVPGLEAMSISGTEELIDFEEMDPPAGYFDIPKDYEWYRTNGVE